MLIPKKLYHESTPTVNKLMETYGMLRIVICVFREKRADKAPARYMERKLYKKEMRIDLKKTYILSKIYLRFYVLKCSKLLFSSGVKDTVILVHQRNL